jgi:hydroxymethylpyrimidine pyrophosphatase-like HAD family hydrolase
MRPLSDLPTEIARDVIGVAFDVDDTLTRHGRLERAAFDALWTLHEAGVRLVAVTGRPLGFAEVYARQWPIDVAVGENGAGWIAWEGDRRRAGFAADVGELERHRAVLAWDVGESHHATDDERARFVAICAEEGASVTTSSVHTHAVPGRWDKATGIELALRDALGLGLVDDARWIFVGDSGNDEAAFVRFPRTSVGVANLRVAELRHRPAYLASRSHGEGFAEVGARVVGARGARP